MATKTIGAGLGSAGPGTVSTVGTTAVVGVSTTFTTSFPLPATIGIAGVTYDIATITNDTNLTTVQTQGTNTNVAYSLGLRNYATLSAWSSYVNALALSAPEVANMYNDAEFTETATVTIGGWTGGSSTNTVTLQAAAGQSFRDNANVQTNALKYNASNGVAVTNSVNNDCFNIQGSSGAYMTCAGIQWKGTNASQGNLVLLGASGISCTFTFLNHVMSHNGGSYKYALQYAGSGATIENFAMISLNAAGRGFRNVNSPCTVANGTIYNSSGSGTARIGCSNSGTPTFTVENVAVAGFTTDYSGTCSTSSNNATDKGSFGGTGWGTSGQVSLVPATEWVATAAGSEDLRLKSTSVKLKDNGATFGQTTDIAGTSRPQGSAYDIGCWELVAASGFKPFWAANSNVVNPRAVAS